MQNMRHPSEEFADVSTAGFANPSGFFKEGSYYGKGSTFSVEQGEMEEKERRPGVKRNRVGPVLLALFQAGEGIGLCPSVRSLLTTKKQRCVILHLLRGTIFDGF